MEDQPRAASAPRTTRLAHVPTANLISLAGKRFAPTIWLAWSVVIAVLALRAPTSLPPAPALLMAVASLWSIALAGGLHALWRSTPRGRASLVGHVLITITNFASAAAITSPNSPALGVIVLWSGITAFETAWWSAWRKSNPRRMRPRAGGRTAKAVVCPMDMRADEPAGELAEELTGDELAGELVDERDDDCEDAEELLLPDGVEQQWTRGVEAAGGEWLEGLVRVRWASRQKHASVPLSFCPPLASPPSVVAQVAEGGDAEVVVAQVHTFGARLELRRTNSSSLEDSLILLVRINRDDA